MPDCVRAAGLRPCRDSSPRRNNAAKLVLIPALIWAGAVCGGQDAAADAAVAGTKDLAANFTFENDVFFHTDHFYTNGAQFEVKRRTDDRWGATRRVLGAVCFAFECDAHGTQLVGTRFKAGQLMYTPTDITNPAPQSGDRPWAGLLYYAVDYPFLSEDGRTLTTVTGEIGVTGPKSFSRDTQRFIHYHFHYRTPEGWNNQIGGSVGLLAAVEHRRAWDAISSKGEEGVQVHSNWHWRLTAGNIFTYVAGGATVVVGKGLPLVSGVEAGSIVDRLHAMTAPVTKDCLFSWLQCTAFASIEGRLVARNVFLDGRFGHDDPHVEKRPFVADASIGARFDFPRTRNSLAGPWFVQFRATHRTPEFKSTFSVHSQNFGALTVGTEY